MALHADAVDGNLALEHSLDERHVAVGLARRDHVILVDVEFRIRIHAVRPDERAVEDSPAAGVERVGFMQRFVPHVVFRNLALVFLQVAFDTRLQELREVLALLGARGIGIVLVETVALVAPHDSVTAQLPAVFLREVHIAVHLVLQNLALLRLVFRPLELVLAHRVPEKLLRLGLVPVLDAVALVARGNVERRTERESMAHELHGHIRTRGRLHGKVSLAEAVDTGFRIVVPGSIHGVGLLDFHVVHLHPALRKPHMERDIVEPVALLVGKERHRECLPLVGELEASAFLLAVVRRAALHHRVDGHVALRLERELVVGRIGKPLGRLKLKAPPDFREFLHHDLHALGTFHAEAHLAELQFHLRGAVRIVPKVPAAIAVRHVAIRQHVLRHDRSHGHRGHRTCNLHSREIHKDLAFRLESFVRLEYKND